MNSDKVQAVRNLKRDDRVRLYYDLSKSKSAVYTVVAVDSDRNRVVYMNVSQVYRASVDYVAANLVAVL